jgi:Tfp pilus assembly protein FimT
MSQRYKSRTGFTLFELVLVLAVIIVVSAIVSPSVKHLYETHQLRQAADMVRAAWHEARAHAIDEGRPYRFAVVPNTGNYRVAPHGQDFWSDGPPASTASSDLSSLVLSAALPKGLRFSEADGAATGPSSLPPEQVPIEAWSTKVIFLPTGRAKSSVDVAFASSGKRELHLHLRGLTGAVTTRWDVNREKAQR